MNVTRILKDTPAVVTLTTYRDGTATDIGTITVTGTKADGTALFTNQAVTDGANGTYAFTFTDEQTANLNFLTLVWTETGGESYTTYVEIVGGHLFTEAQARAFDNAAMTDTTAYPDASIMEERDRITDLLETWTGVSWVPRFRRAQVKGTGGRELWLPNHQVTQLLSASIGSTSQTVGDITVEEHTGRLFHTGQTWTHPTSDDPLNVVVEYIHGYESLQDGVDRIALKLLRDRLVASSITDRATTFSDETGTYRMAGAPTGIPEVNDWVTAHDERLPV